LTSIAAADLGPQWISTLPTGSTLQAGLFDMVTDAAGVTYVTGVTGPSFDTDAVTAAFAPDGGLIWSHVYESPAGSWDQPRGIGLAPDGSLWVVGATPGPMDFAQVLVLHYESATGALLGEFPYTSGFGISEHGESVAVDAAGGIYITGGTVGDGGDALTLKLDPTGDVQWVRTYDGPAFGPFSQDSAWEVLLDPAGNPVVMIHGVMASNHPNYVVIKYSAADGSTLWSASVGVSGGDFPNDMEIDAAGDVYVTGTGIDFIDKYFTVKLNGETGATLWTAYDSASPDNSGRALTLDGQGGVYITGAADPDGDLSNFNDNIFTVKRDAQTGEFIWSHLYGLNCIGCFDVGADVLVDSDGHVFVGGETSSPPYGSDAIVLILDSDSGIETDRLTYSGNPLQTAEIAELAFDSEENLYIAGEFYHVNNGSVEITVSQFPSMLDTPGVPGDLTGDGAVGPADLAIVLSTWGQCAKAEDCPADLNQDGLVGPADLALVLSSWG
jgi:hypothetical protein